MEPQKDIGAALQEIRARKTAPQKDIGAALQEIRARKTVQPEQPQQDGIIKSIVRPFGRLAVNAIKAGQMIAGQDVDKAAPINLPYLGATKPVGQEGTFTQKVKESLGVGAEIASTVVPAGRVAPIARTGLKGLIGQGIKEGAKAGAFSGSIYGAGKAIQDPDATIGSVAAETALGGGIGAIGGGVIGGAIPAIAKPVRGLKNIIQKDVQTLRTEKIAEGLKAQNARLKSVETAFNKNTVTRKLADGTKKTITPIDTLGKYNIAPDFDGNNIVMGDYKIGTGALGKIKNKVQDIDVNIDSALQNSGVSIPLTRLRESLVMGIKNNPELKRSFKVQSTLKRVDSVIAEARRTYGKSIPVQEINEIRKVANFDYSPDTQDFSRVLGDVARKFVYSTDTRVQKLLQEQGELLAARKYAEKINNTKLLHGTIGKHVLRTTGALLGSTIEKAPVLGPVIGMLGGEAAARGLQKAQFKSFPVEVKALLQSRSNKIIPSNTAKTIPKIIPKSSAPIQEVKKQMYDFKAFKRDTSLSKEDSQIQEKAIKKYVQNKKTLEDEYVKTFGAKIVNTDLARRLFKDVGYTGNNSAAVHEASSAVAKDVWKRALQNPETDVILYAGGSGSGKSSALSKLMPKIESNAAGVLDSNLSNYNSAVQKITQAIQAGKSPKVVYVYREPVDAWVNGVIKRMKANKAEGGRIVPLSVFLKNTPDSLSVVRRLKQNGVDVTAIDNSLGAGKARVMTDAALAKLAYPANLRTVLERETKKLLDARKITKKEYDALIK